MALNSPWNIPQLGQDPLVAALLAQQPMQAAPANPNDLTGLSMEQLGEIPVGAGPAIDATQATTQDVGGSYAADMAGVGQKEALAKALMSQAQAPMEQRTAGRFVVANSPLEGLSRVAAGYFGGKAQKDASDAATKADEGETTALSELLRSGKSPEEIMADKRLSPATRKAFLGHSFDMNQLRAKAASGVDDPSNVREYQYYSKLSPDEQARFLEMKRSQGNIGYQILQTPNGPVIVATDPKNVGAQIVGSGQTYGTGVAPRGPNATQVPQGQLPGEAAVNNGFAAAGVVPGPTMGTQGAKPVMGREPTDFSNPFQGASPGEIERQKIQTGLDLAPQVAEAEANQAELVEGAKIRGESGAKQIVAAPAMLNKANDTLAIIDKALGHAGRETATGLSGSLDPRNIVPGTQATDFKVLLKQIKGKAFLEAFDSLRGGGAITQIEGQAATEAMARLDTAQSDAEFYAALKDLHGIMFRAKIKAESLLSGQTQSAGQGANDPLGVR